MINAILMRMYKQPIPVWVSGVLLVSQLELRVLCIRAVTTFQIDNDTEVQNMAKELNANVSKLQTTLQRINAPNMKALEK